MLPNERPSGYRHNGPHCHHCGRNLAQTPSAQFTFHDSQGEEGRGFASFVCREESLEFGPRRPEECRELGTFTDPEEISFWYELGAVEYLSMRENAELLYWWVFAPTPRLDWRSMRS